MLGGAWKVNAFMACSLTERPIQRGRRSSAISALLLGIDRRGLGHQASKFAELLVHFFDLILQVGLIDFADFLRILRVKKLLREIEAGGYIGFCEGPRLVVALLQARIGA